MNKMYNEFIKNHNLINRMYDMLVYFNLLSKTDNEIEIKTSIKKQLANIEYVELTANYFEKKLKKNYNKIELRCNLKELIDDLNYLKQYYN